MRQILRPAGRLALAAGLALALFGPALALDLVPQDEDVTTPGSGLALTPGGAALVNSHTVLHGDVITVRLEDQGDHFRVERVELLGPGGISVIANDLTRQVEHKIGFASDGKPDDNGVGLKGENGTAGLTFGKTTDHRGANYDDVKLAITRAHVRVPNLAAYKADVTQWKFRIRLLDDGGTNLTMEIPAPAPQ